MGASLRRWEIVIMGDRKALNGFYWNQKNRHTVEQGDQKQGRLMEDYCGGPGEEVMTSWPSVSSEKQNGKERIISGHSGCVYVFHFNGWGRWETLACCEHMLSRVQLFATPGTVAARLLCPWNFLSKNTRVGCHFLFHLEFSCWLGHLGRWDAVTVVATCSGKQTHLEGLSRWWSGLLHRQAQGGVSS